MLMDGTMLLAWLGAGAAVGSLTTYRLYSIPLGREKEEKLSLYQVENEALARTNLIYRERIEQLETALFSNDKYMAMAGEIEKLRGDNFKLRSRLRDLECLVQAEKKRLSRERVEELEKTVRELRSRLEKEFFTEGQACHLEIINTTAARDEVAAAVDVEVTPQEAPQEPSESVASQKKWAPVLRVKRITQN